VDSSGPPRGPQLQFGLSSVLCSFVAHFLLSPFGVAVVLSVALLFFLRQGSIARAVVPVLVCVCFSSPLRPDVAVRRRPPRLCASKATGPTGAVVNIETTTTTAAAPPRVCAWRAAAPPSLCASTGLVPTGAAVNNEAQTTNAAAPLGPVDGAVTPISLGPLIILPTRSTEKRPCGHTVVSQTFTGISSEFIFIPVEHEFWVPMYGEIRNCQDLRLALRSSEVSRGGMSPADHHACPWTL
jgi:hypothetical protein